MANGDVPQPGNPIEGQQKAGPNKFQSDAVATKQQYRQVDVETDLSEDVLAPQKPSADTAISKSKGESHAASDQPDMDSANGVNLGQSKIERKGTQPADANSGRGVADVSTDIRKSDGSPTKIKSGAELFPSPEVRTEGKHRGEATPVRSEQSQQKPDSSVGMPKSERGENFSPTQRDAFRDVGTKLEHKKNEGLNQSNSGDATEGGATVKNRQQQAPAAVLPGVSEQQVGAHKTGPSVTAGITFEKQSGPAEKSVGGSGAAHSREPAGQHTENLAPGGMNRAYESIGKSTQKSEMSDSKPDGPDRGLNKHNPSESGSELKHPGTAKLVGSEPSEGKGPEQKQTGAGKVPGSELSDDKGKGAGKFEQDGRTVRSEGQGESKAGGIRGDKDGIRGDKDGIREAFGEKGEPGQKGQQHGAGQPADGRPGQPSNRDDVPIRKESDPREANLGQTGKEPESKTSKGDAGSGDARTTNPKSQDGSDARVPGGKSGAGENSGSGGGILLTDEKSGRRIDGKTPASKGEGVGGGPANHSTGRRPHGELIPELADRPTDKTSKTPGGKTSGGAGAGGGLVTDDKSGGKRIEGKTPIAKGEGVGGGPADHTTGRRPHGELIPELTDRVTDKTKVRDGKNLVPPALVLMPESFTVKGRIPEIIVAFLGTRRATKIESAEPSGAQKGFRQPADAKTQPFKPSETTPGKTQPSGKSAETTPGKAQPSGKSTDTAPDKISKTEKGKGEKASTAPVGKTPSRAERAPKQEGIASAVKAIQRIFDLLPTDQIAKTSRILRIKRMVRDDSETSAPTRPVIPGNVFVPKVGFVSVGRTLSTMFAGARSEHSQTDTRKSNTEPRVGARREPQDAGQGAGSGIRVNVGPKIFEEPASGRKAFAGRGVETKPIYDQAKASDQGTKSSEQAPKAAEQGTKSSEQAPKAAEQEPKISEQAPKTSEKRPSHPSESPTESESSKLASTAGRQGFPVSPGGNQSSEPRTRFTDDTSDEQTPFDEAETNQSAESEEQWFPETVEIPDIEITETPAETDEGADLTASDQEFDDASSGRYQYVVQQGDTIETLSTALLGDIRLAPLLFEKARQFIMAEHTYGCHELIPGSVIDLPTPLEIKRFKQENGWS